MSAADRQCFTIPTEYAGQRLDAALSQLLPELSRSSILNLIKTKNVRVESFLVKPSLRLKGGERVEVVFCFPSEPPRVEPQPIDLDILYEDNELVVINKPAAMVVHPAPGNYRDTLVNALLHRYPRMKEIGGDRPGIVHRLDKDTTGVMVVAKSQMALCHLADQFQTRSLTKKYLALVWGIPSQESGEIGLPIGRHPTDRKKMSVHSRKGRIAQTKWRLKSKYAGLISLLDLEIKTGRTHQIRVHCSAMNHPIVGDPVYGGQPNRKNFAGMNQDFVRQLQGIKRQMLHAWKLSLVHPRTQLFMEFTAPIPADIANIISALEVTTNY